MNKNINVKDLTNIALKAEEQGLTIYEYLKQSMMPENDIKRVAHGFKKHKDAILERTDNIYSSMTTLSKQIQETGKVLSTEFATLASDNFEEQVEIVNAIENSVEKNTHMATVALLMNEKKQFAENVKDKQKLFRSNFSEYSNIWEEYLAAKHAKNKKAERRLILKAMNSEKILRNDISLLKPENQKKLTDKIDNKISEIQSKITSIPAPQPKLVKTKKLKKK